MSDAAKQIEKSLHKRYKQEGRFINRGKSAIISAVIFLIIFLGTIVLKGHKAFITHKINIEIDFSKEAIVRNSILSGNFYRIPTNELIEQISYHGLIREALRKKFVQSSVLMSYRQFID